MENLIIKWENGNTDFQDLDCQLEIWLRDAKNNGAVYFEINDANCIISASDFKNLYFNDCTGRVVINYCIRFDGADFTISAYERDNDGDFVECGWLWLKETF